MNKVIFLLLILFFLVSVVSAVVYVELNASQDLIVGFESDDPAWNNGFRDSADVQSCNQYLAQMSVDARMECLGFKAKN